MRVEPLTAALWPVFEKLMADGAVSPGSTGTGYVSTFVRAGFIEVARRSPERPIMRLVLD